MKFHTLGGGVGTNLGIFTFLFTCSKSCKYEKKSIFCGGSEISHLFFLFRLRTSLQCVCPKQGSVNEGSELQNMDLELGLIKCY